MSDEAWRSPEGSEFTSKYLYFFEQYKESMKFFMPIEVLMNMASGAIGAIDSTWGGCSSAIYTSTVVYSSYAIGLAASRPFASTKENIFSVTVAALQAAPLVIKSIQITWPENTDQTWLNKIRDTIPTIVEIGLIAKTVYDVIDMGKKFMTSVIYSSSKHFVVDEQISEADLMSGLLDRRESIDLRSPTSSSDSSILSFPNVGYSNQNFHSCALQIASEITSSSTLIGVSSELESL